MKAIYEKIINEIPDYKQFMTVDELDESSKRLAEEYPDIVKLFQIGETREKHPLYCLKIGDGPVNALSFGCPHPNEPIGTMMLEHFTRKLAEDKELRDELGYTWYIVKSWDADGTKLNENWFKGPFTLYNYARNFFRPASHQQVDWTFPIDYKNLHFHNTLPETQAMMKLIDDIKPKFIYSLHNAGFGGVYWYMSEDISEVYEELKNAAHKQGIPLSLGEPEAPYCVAYAPAIYAALGIEQDYDYLVEYGVEHPEKVIKAGNCSASYAEDVSNAFTLLTELPYFYNPKINDLSLSDMLRKDAVLENVKWEEKETAFIKSTMEISKKYMGATNPFKLALESFTDMEEYHKATRKMAEINPEYQRKATNAEVFDNLVIAKFYKMLSFGLLVRANETELLKMEEVGEKNEDKKKALTKAFEIAESKLKELDEKVREVLEYEVIPIKKLVSIQLECGLIVADYLNRI